jgi:hypothetical protein
MPTKTFFFDESINMCRAIDRKLGVFTQPLSALQIEPFNLCRSLIDIDVNNQFKLAETDIQIQKDYNTVNLLYGKNASKLNPYIETILKHILFDAGEKSGFITSTSRTVADQARVMYESYLNSDGLKMYGDNGDKVINVGIKAKKEGKSKDEVVQLMMDKINKIGSENVSKHIADPSKYVAVDIAPSQIKNKKAFVKSVEAKIKIGLVKRFLKPEDKKGEKAYHIEIPMPQLGDFINAIQNIV